MDERDDFWDLSSLIPKKKKRPPTPTFATDTPLATVSDEDGAREATSPEGAFSFSFQAEKPETAEAYTPAENPLIESVSVIHQPVGYSFYGQFRKNAIAYLSVMGKAAEYVPYFSYIPQYSQLTKEQLAYYLYFRDALRRGETPRADYSYFWLYIYEILNLPDYIPPKEGIKHLAFAWSSYRDALPQIDKYMTVWLADYCLMHRLPCPLASLSPFLDAVMRHSDLKEFYLGEAALLSDDGICALLAMTSDYHFQKSRYASGEHAAFYKQHLLSALGLVFRCLLSEKEADFGVQGRVSKEWSAFTGSLCAHNIKCRLRVEYHSFSGSATLRKIVTASVKYAENRLRAFFSVKSRLSVQELPMRYREIIDEYFRDLFDRREKEKKEASRPAYEALYEAETKGFSFAGAREIESSSWENARRLVSEEELRECDLTPAADIAEEEAEKTEATGDESYGLSHADAVFLHSILVGDLEEHAWVVRTSGDAEEQFVERINEAFSEHWGDVVLEYSDDGYIVIEDYIEEVMTWTEKQLGKK